MNRALFPANRIFACALLPVVALVVGLAACGGGGAGAIRSGGERPGWTNQPTLDPRFPPDKFVAATGLTSVGSKSAQELLGTLDAAARAELAAALSSVVSSELKSYAKAKNGEESVSAESSVSQTVKEFDLTAAITIVDRFRDGDTVWAFAVLDKQKALGLQQGKLADRARAAETLVAQGDEKAQSAPAEALRSYARARTEADQALAGVLLLRALGGKAELSEGAARAEGKLAGLVSKLELVVESGGGQRAAADKPLAQPVVFAARLGGQPAAGLPINVQLEGGKLEGSVTAGPDGRAPVRVDSAGKFATDRKAVVATVDWARLTGESHAPAWAASLPLKAEAVVVKKGLETTRVVVLIAESVEGGNPVTEPPVDAAVVGALKSQGVSVQDGKALREKLGADKLAHVGPDELRAQAAATADLAVVGSVVSRNAGKAGFTTVWCRARAELRVVDLGSGQVLATFADEEKSKVPGELNAAGRKALEALGEKVAQRIAGAVAAGAQ